MKENKIIFCRDRFGIKPLYYYEDNNEIIFSSEKKPIIKYKNINLLNKNTVLEFFLKGSMDHSEDSFFENIKLEHDYLSSTDKLLDYQNLYFDEELFEKDIQNFYVIYLIH